MNAGQLQREIKAKIDAEGRLPRSWYVGMTAKSRLGPDEVCHTGRPARLSK